MARFYYIGPWVAGQDGFTAPPWAIGALDLRGDSSAPGLGFFVSAAEVVDSSYEPFGDAQGTPLYGVTMSVQARNTWRQMLGLAQRPDAGSLLDVLWDTMTVYADPEGGTVAKPIIPTIDGKIELYLGGHSLVRLRRMPHDPTKMPHWPQVRQVLQKDYERAQGIAQNGQNAKARNAHRRFLGFMQWKYGLTPEAAADLIIPGHLPRELPVRPETTISDNFNRGPEASQGSQGSSGGWWWNDENGSFTIGTVYIVADAGNSLARSASDSGGSAGALSGPDHYGEAEFGSNGAAPASRVSGYNCYTMKFTSSTAFRSAKIVSGTLTELDAYGSHGETGTIVYRVTCNGSTIIFSVNGVEKARHTDTSHPGNNDAGVFIATAGRAEDNFVAADLEFPTPSTRLLKSPIRRNYPLETIVVGADGAAPTTAAPTTPAPTTAAPTTQPPTTAAPTTAAPTTQPPTTAPPTTQPPTTPAPTTQPPTTPAPTTQPPTTPAPTTQPPTTPAPTTPPPTTPAPTTQPPTTQPPTTAAPTTPPPTTPAPTTQPPTTPTPTTQPPTTAAPTTTAPTTQPPTTQAPTTAPPTTPAPTSIAASCPAGPYIDMTNSWFIDDLEFTEYQFTYTKCSGARDPNTGRIWAHFHPDNATAPSATAAYVYYSDDQGRTWTQEEAFDTSASEDTLFYLDAQGRPILYFFDSGTPDYIRFYRRNGNDASPNWTLVSSLDAGATLYGVPQYMVQSANGDFHLFKQGDSNNDVMEHRISTDDLATWGSATTIATSADRWWLDGNPHALPHPNGDVYLVTGGASDASPSSYHLTIYRWNGSSWSIEKEFAAESLVLVPRSVFAIFNTDYTKILIAATWDHSSGAEPLFIYEWNILTSQGQRRNPIPDSTPVNSISMSMSSDGVVHLTYSEYTYPSPEDAVYRRSCDFGLTWSDRERLDAPPGPNDGYQSIQLYLEGTSLRVDAGTHFLWYYGAGDFPVYYGETLDFDPAITLPPTTPAPTTVAPTTTSTTAAPTTPAPTTTAPTTAPPTTPAPTTPPPTTPSPTTQPPTTAAPTTQPPTTPAPTTQPPTTPAPTTQPATTPAPTTGFVTTPIPTTVGPTPEPATAGPTTPAPSTILVPDVKRRPGTSVAWRAETKQLVVRAWIEESLRSLVVNPLSIGECTATLRDADGVTREAVAAADAGGTNYVTFTFDSVRLVADTKYVVLLNLRTSVGGYITRGVIVFTARN